jgi:hypothetical protein
MSDRNNNLQHEDWKNREDQDLKKDTSRHEESVNRDHEDSKNQKVANTPGTGSADSSTSNDMSTGGLVNSRTGRDRTSVPHTKTFTSGTDDDGQSV